jgi:hypothetical protein
MTYGRGHLLMPHLVARIRIMAHRLASPPVQNRGAAVISSLATDFESHTVE